MSKAEKKLARAKRVAAAKASSKDYRAQRELGPCFVEKCGNNGDSILHCNFCAFKVQACSEHYATGRNKAKRHLMLKHPAKTLPTLMMGVLRGQSLD